MIRFRLSKGLDVVAGVLIGGVVWAVVYAFLGWWLPILGWIFSALAGGYYAGKIGGGAAGVVLAVIVPVATFVLAGLVLSILSQFLPFVPSVIFGLLGIGIAAWEGLQALINLVFVGIGGYLGSKHYKPSSAHW